MEALERPGGRAPRVPLHELAHDRALDSGPRHTRESTTAARDALRRPATSITRQNLERRELPTFLRNPRAHGSGETPMTIR